MKIAILGSCTMSKALPTPRENSILYKDRGITPEQWLADLGPGVIPAQDYYKGQAFKRLLKTAQKQGADLLIASAGLGLVKGDEPIPCYDASFSWRSIITVRDRYTDGNHADWFWKLTRLRGNGDLLAEYDLVIATTTRSYETILGPHSDSLLFLTLKPNKSMRRLLTYDWRLYDPRSPYRSNAIEFGARSVEHYFDHVFPSTEQSALENALAQWDHPKDKVYKIW